MKLNGCHNRPAYVSGSPAQDGWWVDGDTRVARMTYVPFRMQRACQYTHTELGQKDTGCTGCKHRKDA